jgi:hypothetical protein
MLLIFIGVVVVSVSVVAKLFGGGGGDSGYANIPSAPQELS